MSHLRLAGLLVAAAVVLPVTAVRAETRHYGGCTFVSGAANVCENADLRGANLSGMDLRGAKLHGSNLAGANIEGSLLDNADLSSVVLNHANLFASILSGANLHGSQLEFVKAHLTHFAKANLRVANFAGANLSFAVLHEANAEGANFYGTTLTFASFASANIRGTNFAHATFFVTHMGGTDATNANFFPSNLGSDWFAAHGLFVRIDERVYAYGDSGSCRVVRPTSGYDTVDWNDQEVSCGGASHGANQSAFQPRVWFNWFRMLRGDERRFTVGIPTGIYRLEGIVQGNGAYAVTKVHGMAGFPSGITEPVGSVGGRLGLNLQWEGDGYFLHMAGWLPRHTGMVTSLPYTG
jgi:hypothetical protein